jgi:sulfonate dioxygenase
LNYNPTFIERIEELNGQESRHILAFLREHLLQADDLTVRWKWTPGAVAFWDNRSVAHRAIPGGYDVTLREGKRTAVHGERPFWDPERSESLSQRLERLTLETKNGVSEQNGHKPSTGINGQLAQNGEHGTNGTNGSNGTHDTNEHNGQTPFNEH